MATTLIDIATPAGLKKFRETDLNGTKAAVDTTSGTLHAIIIDNTANTGEATYVKLWDAASGSVTVGTTAPDWTFKVPASTKRTLSFLEGVAYGTALTAACVTTAGTAGTTNPTNDVVVEILFET